MMYIAAQVVSIDLKIDPAVQQVMIIYKRIVRSASVFSMIPGANIVNHVTLAMLMCKAVINYFGVPSVSAATVQNILKSIIWDEMGHGVSVAFAKGVVTLGISGTSITLAGTPVFLTSTAINTPIVVPTNARLLLMLACNVMLSC